jgi:hypothetical protein
MHGMPIEKQNDVVLGFAVCPRAFINAPNGFVMHMRGQKAVVI